MDELILNRIYESVKQGKSVAMVVITEEIGSSPRKSGSMMAVWSDGETLGSVGGGMIEYTVTNLAKECIEKKENNNFSYTLNEKDLGMQCGGTVKGYIKVFLPQNKLVIVGAGHVGQKINEIAKTLNFYTVVVDDREEYATKAYFPNSDEILVGDYNQVLGKYSLTENDYVVIVTRGQDNDLSSLRAVVNRRLAYIGMIGSARKIRYVMNELIKEGVEEEKLRGVYAPMGLDIASNTPVEIALSIMSEILLLKNNGTLNHRKNVRKVWE